MMCPVRITLASCLVFALFAPSDDAATVENGDVGRRMVHTEGWHVQSSVLTTEDGAALSKPGFAPEGWFATKAPATVLSTLVKHGVYPDPRIGMNQFRVPDASDAFNTKHDLPKFSHLPDKRNPWRDPYWYRTEFNIAAIHPGRHVWLGFDCINYRAEVWLNGKKIAGPDTTVGMFQRFRFDVTEQARVGKNALAVKVFPVDHPGEPETQVDVFGKDRDYHKEIAKDVTSITMIGYDCMGTVSDRNMGLIQDVYVEQTGPVDVRHPFIVTHLPLPATDRATLDVSAELVNATQSAVKGTLRGTIEGTDVTFRAPVEIAANETRTVTVDPRPVLANPRLWWPAGYGEQSLYTMTLTFEAAGAISDTERLSFGVRDVKGEIYERDGWHGRRFVVNGRKVFAQGGYIQPELFFEWDDRRIDAELRYYRDANLNLIFFEDIPNPPDSFLDACDRYGVMFGNCFYNCGWPRPGTNDPEDFGLLERCTVDLFKRYRNHPSLVMYMVQNEDDTRRDVYEMFRKHARGLDGSRFWIPSGYYADDRKNVPEWTRADLPSGMNDTGAKTYSWVEPATYFDWVGNERSWMFKIENGSASVPPISSLVRFLTDLGEKSDKAPFPLTPAWAQHDACHYFKDYDKAVRRLYGEPESVVDYCWKAHLVTADQHRAMHEAVQHRMWDITGGFTQWKINAAWPSVEWQLFDWYLKPMVSHDFVRRACAPLHVQLNLPERTVCVVNRELDARQGLQVSARVFNPKSERLWEKAATCDVGANTYRELFEVEAPADVPGGVYLVRLDLADAQGRPISCNLYWLRTDDDADYKPLNDMPLASLRSEIDIKESGAGLTGHVKVTNPGDQIALMVQLTVTDEATGTELLPVHWSDNRFSLLPGEAREVTAEIPAWAASGKMPRLEVGGWNVASAFECSELTSDRQEVKAGEPLRVRATIGRTFLDGSRVPLTIDGEPNQMKWSWAREKPDHLDFTVKIDHPGTHTMRVGEKTLTVVVK